MKNQPISIEDLVKLDDYEEISVKQLVIELCLDANFITEPDIERRTKRFRWLENSIDRCIYSMSILDSSDSSVEQLNKTVPTLENVDLLMSLKHQKAREVATVIASKIEKSLEPFNIF
ncbi:hypothetical protein WOC09_18080 [Vibrio parahaemolyticus]|uniref:hypothetical protein n=1 Tax=Vibrio parahaemolyticus TaxID=670 RepID=UPI0012AE5288|nr:hypothetical protein [Vibrio parahaemolyticus]EJC6864090.1 hypothetical protein [Vibrio parahaemolyticus]EJC7041525.1 hypothetical protein [Vibrio parahaemolyticus]EJE4733675.1 hypothetical protein [Vibrio parahaemolyticus]